MKLNRIIVLLAVTAIIATCSTGCVTEEKREAKLQAQAKVSKEQAEKTALAKVPGGTIKEGELEKEHGKLIWSFDISMPNSTDIKEVQVDAISSAGDVLQLVLPATAGGLTLGLRDWQGTLQLAESSALTLGVTYGLKYSVHETRPNGGSQSFPSGHSSISFSAAEFLRKRY